MAYIKEEMPSIPAENDVDTQPEARPVSEDLLQKLCQAHGATWDGPADPHDPYNWSSWRKNTIVILVSAGHLVALMSASITAAALPRISEDLGLDLSVTQISFSIYMLGLGFSPFLIAALSEMYGRKPVWLGCNAWYILWNSLCPVGNSAGLMIAGRFLTGMGAGVGITLTGPILADMYRAKDRGKSLAIAGVLPYLGPALGPIVGGLVSQNVRWQWLFWVVSLFDAGITIVGVFVVAETYTPVLLCRKAARQDPSRRRPEHPLTMAFYVDLFSQLGTNLKRPVFLLLKSPVIQLIAFVYALDFGIYCIVLSTFATLWIERFHQTESVSSLHYISLAIGFAVAAQVGGRVMDLIYRNMAAKRNGQELPEFRVPFMIPAVILTPAGLLWYAWSVEQNLHWVMIDIGVAIFTCGGTMLFQALMAYMLDEFEHAASANAAVRLLSNIFAFTFPIFAPQLYEKLGYGWGNSLLTLLFIVLGCPTPLIFWFWGKRMRAVGKPEF